MFGLKLPSASSLMKKKESRIKPTRASSYDQFLLEIGVVIYFYLFFYIKKIKTNYIQSTTIVSDHTRGGRKIKLEFFGFKLFFNVIFILKQLIIILIILINQSCNSKHLKICFKIHSNHGKNHLLTLIYFLKQDKNKKQLNRIFLKPADNKNNFFNGRNIVHNDIVLLLTFYDDFLTLLILKKEKENRRIARLFI